MNQDQEPYWCIVALGYHGASYIMYRSDRTKCDDILPESDLLEDNVVNTRELERQPPGLYRLIVEPAGDEVRMIEWECLAVFPPLDSLTAAMPALNQAWEPIVQQTTFIGQRLRQIQQDERR